MINPEKIIESASMRVNKVHCPEFESVQAAIEFGSQPASPGWKEPNDRSSRDDDKKFRGTASWDEAKQLADDGWAKGRAKVAANLAAIFESGAASLTSMPAVTHEVGGAYPDVPLYVAGEVAHMVNEGDDQLGHRPIIRLLIDLTASCAINQSQLANRGAAVAALVDQIESAGNSCEVWCTFATESNRKLFAPLISVKTAGAPLPIDELAFAIGHPSMLRRVMFALIEADDFTDNADFEHGYGMPRQLPAVSLDPTVIYIPGIVNDGGASRTPEAAMDEVRTSYNRQAADKGLREVGQ